MKRPSWRRPSDGRLLPNDFTKTHYGDRYWSGVLAKGCHNTARMISGIPIAAGTSHLGIGFLVQSSCGGPRAAPQSETSVRSVLLNGEDQPLRDDFNRDQGFVRLHFVVDPIGPGCLRGLADMGDDVLAKLPKDARIKVYVVHDPVIGGTQKDIPAAAELLHTTLAQHYWDPTGDFGRQMSQVLGLAHR